ncbi:MAG: hypothetical protein ACE5JU_09170 [Candidatus Binatia bacterium]
MKEIEINVLTDEALKLLGMEIDELYATLGAQLLSQNLPTRTAGIVSYLSAARSASEAKTFYEALPSGPAMTEWGKGLGVIYEELKRDGIGLLNEVRDDLKKALFNEDVLRISDQINRSTVQVIVIIVGAALRMPREFDPISVTIAVILLKLGLRNFCR